jgi:Na+-transporting methylmalonyl-CoA/oxaloacetate decarboxylase beta subunit
MHVTSSSDIRTMLTSLNDMYLGPCVTCSRIAVRNVFVVSLLPDASVFDGLVVMCSMIGRTIDVLRRLSAQVKMTVSDRVVVEDMLQYTSGIHLEVFLTTVFLGCMFSGTQPVCWDDDFVGFEF